MYTKCCWVRVNLEQFSLIIIAKEEMGQAQLSVLASCLQL